MLTDLDFFEQELMRYQDSLATAVVDRRAQQGLMLDDPDEELAEVYGEIQTIEADFKKAVDICKHLLGHSRELFERNRSTTADLDQLRHEHDLLVNSNVLHSTVIQQSEDNYKNSQAQQREAEANIKQLKEETLERDE